MTERQIYVDESEATEIRANSHNGTYIGTVSGDPEERDELACAVQEFMSDIRRMLGRQGQYGAAGIQVVFKNGRLVSADNDRTKTRRPRCD